MLFIRQHGQLAFTSLKPGDNNRAMHHNYLSLSFFFNG